MKDKPVHLKEAIQLTSQSIASLPLLKIDIMIYYLSFREMIKPIFVSKRMGLIGKGRG